MRKSAFFISLLVCSFFIFACSSYSDSPSPTGEVAPPSESSSASSEYSREALIKIMDQYLDALAENDPTVIPLAEDAVLVENNKKYPERMVVLCNENFFKTIERKYHNY